MLFAPKFLRRLHFFFDYCRVFAKSRFLQKRLQNSAFHRFFLCVRKVVPQVTNFTMLRLVKTALKTSIFFRQDDIRLARKEVCVCLIRIANKQLKVVESTTQMTAYEVTIHLSEASQLILASHETSDHKLLLFFRKQVCSKET